MVIVGLEIVGQAASVAVSTIAILAAMIKAALWLKCKQDERFDRVESKAENNKQGITTLDKKLEKHMQAGAGNREYFDDKFAVIDKHFERLNGTVHEHDKDIGDIKVSVAHIEGRLDGDDGGKK